MIDAIAVEAGLDPARLESKCLSVRAGSGGALLVALSGRGQRVLLRVAAEGADGDPRPSADALTALRAAGVSRIPRILAGGTCVGLAWTVETYLPGRPPRTLTESVIAQAAEFAAALPFADRPPDPTRLSQAVAAHLPELAGLAEEIEAQVAQAVGDLPGIVAHGDFWSGNLLVAGEELSGVIDWDGYRGRSVPGVDLLHLIGTAERKRAGRSLGEEFLTKPWRREPAAHSLTAYLDRLNLPGSPEVLDGIGLAWWASQAAGDLLRTPALARDGRWVDRNLRNVLGWGRTASLR